MKKSVNIAKAIILLLLIIFYGCTLTCFIYLIIEDQTESLKTFNYSTSLGNIFLLFFTIIFMIYCQCNSISPKFFYCYLINLIFVDFFHTATLIVLLVNLDQYLENLDHSFCILYFVIIGIISFDIILCLSNIILLVIERKIIMDEIEKSQMDLIGENIPENSFNKIINGPITDKIDEP